jgi:hypothetical protein
MVAFRSAKLAPAFAERKTTLAARERLLADLLGFAEEQADSDCGGRMVAQ